MAGFVQAIGNNSTNVGAATSTLTITATAGVSIGDTLVITACIQTSDAVVSVSDTRGNTYQSDLTSTLGKAIFVLSSRITTAIITGDVITVTFSAYAGTGYATRVDGFVLTGLATTSWLDQAAETAATSATPTSPSVTTTQASEVLIGVACYANAGSTFTAGTGYTLIEGFPVSGLRVATEYQVVSSTGSYTSSGTITSAAWTQAIVTYKASTGPAFMPAPFHPHLQAVNRANTY